MSFIDEIKLRAKSEIKTIVLPEATDIRVLKAASIALKEGFANIILVGNKEEILKKANENNLDISKSKIEDPYKSEKYDKFVNYLYELRQRKGMTLEKAKKLILDPVYYGMIMVKLNSEGADRISIWCSSLNC